MILNTYYNYTILNLLSSNIILFKPYLVIYFYFSKFFPYKMVLRNFCSNTNFFQKIDLKIWLINTDIKANEF